MKVIEESVKNKIVSLLVEGVSKNQIHKDMKLSYPTITKIEQLNLEHIKKLKKDNLDASLKSNSQKYSKLMDDTLDKIRVVLPEITIDKLKNCSAPQLAMVLGVLVDKYNNALGIGLDSSIHIHTTETKEELLKKIMDKDKQSDTQIPVSSPSMALVVIQSDNKDKVTNNEIVKSDKVIVN